MKRVLAGLLLGFVFLVSASHDSYAETRGPGGTMGMGFPGEGMLMMPPMGHHGMGIMEAEHPLWRKLMSLNLDEKQREAINEIKSRVEKDSIRKRADLEVANIELRDILDKDPVDLNAAEAKLKKTESLLLDIRLSHIKALEEVKAKLTPEQRKKLKETKETLETGSMIGGMMPRGMRAHPPCEKK